MVDDLRDEKEFVKDREFNDSFERIEQILSMDNPYKLISEIPANIQKCEQIYKSKLANKKVESKKIINNLLLEVMQYKNDKNTELFERYKKVYTDKLVSVDMTQKITILDATTSNLYSTKDAHIQKLIEEGKEEDDNQKTVKYINKASLLTPKQLTKADVDAYVQELRDRLNAELEDADSIQIY